MATNTPAVVRRVQRAVDVGQQLENDAEVFARLRANVGEQRSLQYRVLSQQIAARYEMTVSRQNQTHGICQPKSSRQRLVLCPISITKLKLTTQPKFLTYMN